jgi:cell fate (sporulation/competence/biofilm development) regulator YlbF (YheA/YmcA/DUF963 family)
MNNLMEDQAALALSAVCQRTVRDFAAALIDTVQFKAFTQASEALSKDKTAEQAMDAYQAKQESLRALWILKAVSNDDRAELESLRLAVLAQPTVSTYVDTEQTLIALLQSITNVISQRIGLPFAVSASKCCG